MRKFREDTKYIINAIISFVNDAKYIIITMISFFSAGVLVLIWQQWKELSVNEKLLFYLFVLIGLASLYFIFLLIERDLVRKINYIEKEEKEKREETAVNGVKSVSEDDSKLNSQEGEQKG